MAAVGHPYVAESPGPGRPADDSPTTAMRVVIGALITAIAALVVATIAPVLAFLFLALLAMTAALVARHTIALDVDTLAHAHWLGLGAIVACLLSTCLVRWRHHAKRERSSALTTAIAHQPLASAGLLLFGMAAMLLRVAWDAKNPGVVGTLAAGVVIDGLYLLGLGCVVFGVVTFVRVAVRGYRWSVGTRYRAGLATGVMLVVVVPLLIGQVLPAPSPASTQATKTFPNLRGISFLEAERDLLARLSSAFDSPPTPPSSTGPASFGSASPSPSDALEDCFVRLAAERSQVEGMLRSKHKLSEDDAKDAVGDAILKVCVAHSKRAYPNLGGALTTAAKYRAIDWKRRSRTVCGVDSVVPVCERAAPDEVAAVHQALKILDAAYCLEREPERDIIYRRAFEEQDFATIGAAYGISADEARTIFHNAARRMAAKYAKACGL